MTARRPSGFNNQPEWLTASEAIALLGVKRDTLYAYASRGLVRRAGTGHGRNHYAREDVLRLRARHDARAGHGPVAASALHWGDPVLSTSISRITPDGPELRGYLASALAHEGHSFEHVAQLLWRGALPSGEAPWKHTTTQRLPDSGADVLSAVTLHFASKLARRVRLPESEASRAVTDDSPEDTVFVIPEIISQSLCPHATVYGSSIAERLLSGCGVVPEPHRVRAVNHALILVADHELNPSTFAARVAASTGTTLVAALIAAVATMSGTRHGAASDVLEDILERDTLPDDTTVKQSDLPGFGHALYPSGDPRAMALFELARGLNEQHPTMQKLNALCKRESDARGVLPNVDAGLVALRSALGLPRGGAAALFVLGRTAGWIAHALEQRATGTTLRPRALYVPTR